MYNMNLQGARPVIL